MEIFGRRDYPLQPVDFFILFYFLNYESMHGGLQSMRLQIVGHD